MTDTQIKSLLEIFVAPWLMYWSYQLNAAYGITTEAQRRIYHYGGQS